MLFNSLQFMIFFPVVTILYFIIPHKFRWFLLLTASCVFYMAFIPVYILILVVTILIDYFAGMLIEKTEGKKKKIYLIISIISTCLVLFIFKYFNFFNTNFANIAHFFHWNYSIEALKIILPIGLSFHTFQSLSYVIEVYRGRQKAEKNFGIYSLYVMFYPQLVAGPIERPQNLLHQFYEEHKFDYQRVTDGLKIMAWGLFKKVVIADRLSIFVNAVYNNPHDYQGISLIIATVFFAFQIYCDFSGYSDIAIGAAQVMGFKLMDNFNRPYFSKSISEFWKRWHISLSTWFRDYVYISLGGNRVSIPRVYFNLFITFLLSGFWHGANWTFVIWGALNGAYLIMSIITEDVRKKITTSIINFTKKYKVLFITCTIIIIFSSVVVFNVLYIIKNSKNVKQVVVTFNYKEKPELDNIKDIIKVFRVSPSNKIYEINSSYENPNVYDFENSSINKLLFVIDKDKPEIIDNIESMNLKIGDNTINITKDDLNNWNKNENVSYFNELIKSSDIKINKNVGVFLAPDSIINYNSKLSKILKVSNWSGDMKLILKSLFNSIKFLILFTFFIIIINLIYSFIMKKERKIKLFPSFSYKYVKVFITFTLVCFAWIFFRAKNLSDAIYIITNIPKISFDFNEHYIMFGKSQYDFFVAIISILFMEFVHLIQRHGKIRHMLSDKPVWIRWVIYYCLIMSIILFGVFDLENAQFIYFQF